MVLLKTHTALCLHQYILFQKLWKEVSFNLLNSSLTPRSSVDNTVITVNFNALHLGQILVREKLTRPFSKGPPPLSPPRYLKENGFYGYLRVSPLQTCLLYVKPM